MNPVKEPKVVNPVQDPETVNVKHGVAVAKTPKEEQKGEMPKSEPEMATPTLRRRPCSRRRHRSSNSSTSSPQRSRSREGPGASTKILLAAVVGVISALPPPWGADGSDHSDDASDATKFSQRRQPADQGGQQAPEIPIGHRLRRPPQAGPSTEEGSVKKAKSALDHPK